MKRHILIALDDSQHSRRALKYAARMFSSRPHVRFTLMNVHPMISDYVVSEAKTDARMFARLKQIEEKNKTASMDILHRGCDRMADVGVERRRIDIYSAQRQIGLAKDIMEHGIRHSFDAIAVGRRGMSRVQRAVMGSVSAKLLENSRWIPLWVVDGTPENKSVLVALDGSESSYRCIEHVSTIFEGDPDVTFVLYHVMPSAMEFLTPGVEGVMPGLDELVASADRAAIERVYAAATRMLNKAGIDESRIACQSVKKRGSIGQMILSAAEKKGAGTVVVGKRGMGRAFYFGSVSRYVCYHLKNGALWIVP